MKKISDILNSISKAQQSPCEPPDEWAVDSSGRPIAGRCCGIMPWGEYGVETGICTDDVSQQDCWERYGGDKCCANGVDDWWKASGHCVYGDCDCWQGSIGDGPIPITISPGTERCFGGIRCIVNMGSFRAGDDIDVTFSAERGSGINRLGTWAFARLVPEWSPDQFTGWGAAQSVTNRSPMLRWDDDQYNEDPNNIPHEGPQRFKLKISEGFWDPVDDYIKETGTTWWGGLYWKRIYFMVFYDNRELFKTKGPMFFFFDVTRPKPDDTKDPIKLEGPNLEKPEIKPFAPGPSETEL